MNLQALLPGLRLGFGVMDVGHLASVADRIRYIRGKRGLVEFGAPLGVSAEGVRQWESGGTKSPTAANLFRIEEVYGYSARWISDGEGPERAPAYWREPARRALLRVVELLPEHQLDNAARVLGALT